MIQIACLVSADETISAVDCQIVDGGLIIGLLGVDQRSPPEVELFSKQTGDRYTVALPAELTNQPIYMVGEEIPLTIIPNPTDE